MKSLSTRLSVPKVITFADALVNLSSSAAAVSEEPVYAALLAKASGLLASLTTAYQSDRTLSPLAASDEKRDDLLSRLIDYVSGCTGILDDRKREAAEKIRGIIAKYGKESVRVDYATESARIKSLLEDLSDASLQASLDLFPDAQALIAALTEAENSFKALNTEYTQAKAAEKDKDAAYKIKKELLELINKQVLPYLSVMATAQPDIYGTFANQIEVELTRANASVSRAKAAETEAEREA